jgi:hypothetical protein
VASAKETTTVRVLRDIHLKLKIAAAKKRMPIEQIVEQLIADWLKRNG